MLSDEKEGIAVFSRLLIPSDLFAASDAVMNCLPALRRYGAAKCLLVACLPIYKYLSITPEQLESDFRSNLQRQQELLEKQGFQVETRLVRGIADEAISQIAVDEQYSVIVTGSVARSLAREAFAGGLAYDLIHTTQKPVLLLRLEEDPQGGVTCIHPNGCVLGRHVLFPTDFSQNAADAFRYVEQLVKDGVEKITLLHVQDQAKIAPFLLDKLHEFNEIDEGRLTKMKAALQALAPAKVDIRLVYGSPDVEIIQFIKQNDVSLVVMGSQGRGFLNELFLGSVSHQVARKSRAAVLLIPARRST